jgi:hypothetical protein
MAYVVHHLPCKHKGLSPNPALPKKKFSASHFKLLAQNLRQAQGSAVLKYYRKSFFFWGVLEIELRPHACKGCTSGTAPPILLLLVCFSNRVLC